MPAGKLTVRPLRGAGPLAVDGFVVGGRRIGVRVAADGSVGVTGAGGLAVEVR